VTTNVVFPVVQHVDKEICIAHRRSLLEKIYGHGFTTVMKNNRAIGRMASDRRHLESVVKMTFFIFSGKDLPNPG